MPQEEKLLLQMRSETNSLCELFWDKRFQIAGRNGHGLYRNKFKVDFSQMEPIAIGTTLTSEQQHQ